MEEAEAVEFSPSYRILEVTEESDDESNHNHLKHDFSASQHEQSHRETAQSIKNQYQTHKQPQQIVEIDENLDDGEEQSFQYSKKKVDSSGKEIEEYYQNISFHNSPNQPPLLQMNNGSNIQPSQKINQNNTFGYTQQQQQQLQQPQNVVPQFNVQISRNGEKYELKNASKNLMPSFNSVQNQQNQQGNGQKNPVQIFKPQKGFGQQPLNQNIPPPSHLQQQQEDEASERKLSVQPVRLIDQEAFLTKVSPTNQSQSSNQNMSAVNSISHHSNSSQNVIQQPKANSIRGQLQSPDRKINSNNNYQTSNSDNQFSEQVQYLISKRTQAQQKKDQVLSSQKKNFVQQQLLNGSDDEMDDIRPMSLNPNKPPLTLVQQENLERQYKEVVTELQDTQKQLDEVDKSLRIETLNFEESKRHVLILKMALQQKVEENTLRSILAEVCQDSRINKVDLYTYLARKMNQQQLEGDKNKQRIVELERQLKKQKAVNDEQSKQIQKLQEFSDSVNNELKNAIYALQLAEDEKEKMLAEQKQQISEQHSHEKDQLLDYLTDYKNQIDLLQSEIDNFKHQVNSKALNYSCASENSNPNKNSQVQQQITAGDVNNNTNQFSGQKHQHSSAQQLQGSPELIFNNLNNNNQDSSYSLQNNQTSLNYSKNINNDSTEGKQNLLNNRVNQNNSNGGGSAPQYIHLDDNQEGQEDSQIQNFHMQHAHNLNEVSQSSENHHQPQNLQKRFQDEELEELLKEIEEISVQKVNPDIVMEKLLKLAEVAKRLKSEIEQTNLMIDDYKVRLDNERQNHTGQIKELFEQLSQTRQELRAKKDQYESIESHQLGYEEQMESYHTMLQQKQEELEKVNEELRQLRQIAGDRLQEMNEVKLKYELENNALQQEVEQLNVIVQEYGNSTPQDRNSSEDRVSSIQFNSQRSGQQIAIRQSNSPHNYDTYQSMNTGAKQINEQNQLISRQTQPLEQESTQHYNVSTFNNQIERLQNDLYSKDQEIAQLVEEAKQKEIQILDMTDHFEKQIEELNQQIEDIQSEKETIIHENEYCKKEVQKLMEKDLINTNRLKDKKELKQVQQQLDSRHLDAEKLALEKNNLNHFVEAYRKFIFSENIKRAIQEYISVLENVSSIEYNRVENTHKINSLEVQQTQEEYQNDIIKIKEEIISLKEGLFALDDQKKVLITKKLSLEKEIENLSLTESERHSSWINLEDDHSELQKKMDRQGRELSLKDITYKNVQIAYNDLLKEYGRLLSQSITQPKKPLTRNQSAVGGQTFLLNKSLQSNLSQPQFSPNKRSTIQEVSVEDNTSVENEVYNLKKSPDTQTRSKSRYESNDITSSNCYDNMLIIDNEENAYINQQHCEGDEYQQNQEPLINVNKSSHE